LFLLRREEAGSEARRVASAGVCPVPRAPRAALGKVGADASPLRDVPRGAAGGAGQGGGRGACGGLALARRPGGGGPGRPTPHRPRGAPDPFPTPNPQPLPPNPTEYSRRTASELLRAGATSGAPARTHRPDTRPEDHRESEATVGGRRRRKTEDVSKDGWHQSLTGPAR
ncbi:unnamed protein product, partial [Prorocentrum cordatum]